MEPFSETGDFLDHAPAHPPINTLRFSDLLQRIHPVYQQVVEIRGGLRPYFYESLARIEGDISGALYADMLKRAETVGVIHRVDIVMLENALKQLNVFSHITLSVNLSPHTLSRVGNQVVELIRNNADVANRLILEVLETSPIKQPEICVPVFKKCRELGVSFAVDDFGYRHADMRMLEIVQPEILKLHASVLDDAMLNADFTLLDRAIEYAWSNNSMLVAEYIDTPDKFYFAAQNGIHMMQGFLFSRPVRVPPWYIGWIDQQAKIVETADH